MATAVGGIPYLIDQDVSGYLFTPGDAETLGKRLADFVQAGVEQGPSVD